MSTPALRVNGIKYPDGTNALGGVFNVKDPAYGAKGDGVTDDTAAITSAVTAASTAFNSGLATGGVVFFPRGVYICNSALALSTFASKLQHIVLQGTNGEAVGNPYGPSTIIFTGTGSASFLQMNYARYCSIKDLTILYSSSTFTGSLVDFSATTANQNSGGTVNHIEACTFGSSDQVVAHGVFNAGALINFSNVYSSSIKKCAFAFAKIGIQLAATASDFANSIEIDDNRFSYLITAGIVNAAEKDTITNNTFEPGTLGGVTMYPAYLDNRGATTFCQSMQFVDNWIGDGDGSQAIFDSTANTVYALTMERNFLTSGAVKLGNMIGGSVSKNYLDRNIICAVSGTYVGAKAWNNAFSSAPVSGSYFTNLPAGLSVVGNNQTTATTGSGDRLTLGGFTSYAGATTALPPAPWITPTLLNSWVNFGSSYSTAAYYKDVNGRVYIKGMVKSGTSTSATIMTLPAGYRPLEIKAFASAASSAFCIIQVDTAGNVAAAFSTGSTVWTNLDGISFLAEA